MPQPAHRVRSPGAVSSGGSSHIASPQRQTASYRLVDDRSDEQLLVDHRTGDPNAFRILMERYHDDLLRFLIRFMGDRQAAEDVFQEAFLQIHASSESFDESRRFKPWLFTIAANKGRDHHRKSARRPTLGLSATLGGEDEGRSFVDLMEVDVAPPESAMDARERDRLVQEAVDELPDHYREILLLAYFQKMSYSQIADILEIPLGTVKSRLHAAVAAFAKCWQKAGRED
ncbi:MAG: sigma-70 family RNA polymerase sigma factor [Planctomycetota bacterium]|nr:sigma-70 family RNA polymerase sigma factor [Planctomycetota bacterium]